MRFALLGVLAFILSGCTSKPSLSGGEWTAKLLGGTTTFVFGGDGSLKMDVGLPIGSIDAAGIYSETDDGVSLTLQRIKLPDNPIAGGAIKLTDQIVNRPIGFEAEWKSPDEVLLTPRISAGPFGQVMTLKRKGS